ncbi:MAG: hypothetical protein ACYTX0_33390 [Nostoc sp.]
MLKPKSKSQPARLLSYGQSTSTPIAMAITITAGGTILSILLQIVNIGMSSSTNHHVKGMTVVQLQDGSISPGKFAAPNEREKESPLTKQLLSKLSILPNYQPSQLNLIKKFI